MKPISYKKEREDMESICTREGPTGSCSVSLAREHYKPLLFIEQFMYHSSYIMLSSHL